jgi:hypothetical protein
MRELLLLRELFIRHVVALGDGTDREVRDESDHQ